MKINLILLSILLLYIAVPLKAQENVCPIPTGNSLPSVKLIDVSGEEQELNEVAIKQPSIIIFYRGGWCPYCMKHLKDIQKIVTELNDLGYQIIAISPDTPEEAGKTKEAKELSFSLFSDTSAAAMNAFGIAFSSESKKHPVLPVPSIFLTDKNGTIVFQHVDPKYSKRMDAEILIQIARAYKK